MTEARTVAAIDEPEPPNIGHLGRVIAGLAHHHLIDGPPDLDKLSALAVEIAKRLEQEAPDGRIEVIW